VANAIGNPVLLIPKEMFTLGTDPLGCLPGLRSDSRAQTMRLLLECSRFLARLR
jgi:hypothetical protein